MFTFHCNKWLSKSEDDKQILRELTCGTSAKGSSPDMRGDRTGRYCKVPKFSDARKLCCNLSKIQTKSPILRVFSQEDANGIANSEDPDQTAPLTAPLGAV